MNAFRKRLHTILFACDHTNSGRECLWISLSYNYINCSFEIRIELTECLFLVGSFLGLPSPNSEIYDEKSVDSVFETESENFEEMIKNIGASGLLQEYADLSAINLKL